MSVAEGDRLERWVRKSVKSWVVAAVARSFVKALVEEARSIFEMRERSAGAVVGVWLAVADGARREELGSLLLCFCREGR